MFVNVFYSYNFWISVFLMYIKVFLLRLCNFFAEHKYPPPLNAKPLEFFYISYRFWNFNHTIFVSCVTVYLTVYLEFGILENLLPLKCFGIVIFEDEWNFFFCSRLRCLFEINQTITNSIEEWRRQKKRQRFCLGENLFNSLPQ